MISRWQILGLLILALLLAAFAIYTNPNSYAHAVLTGQCRHEPAPDACHLHRRRR